MSVLYNATSKILYGSYEIFSHLPKVDSNQKNKTQLSLTAGDKQSRFSKELGVNSSKDTHTNERLAVDERGEELQTLQCEVPFLMTFL